MSGPSIYEPKTAIERWLDSRLPIIRFGVDFMDFPTPKNLNYWWTFGAILTFCLVAQIVTGIVLAMHYDPSGAGAFTSVEGHIMRDVDYGWLIRSLHANGASMFFLAVYLHMARGIYYGSYKAPREVLWLLGCVIYVLMMATAFMGYVLPWGQMSFWGAKVITNLLGAIPVIGATITTLLWGGFAVDSPTLNRFFSLHYLLPFVIAAVVFLHVWALHVPGNNNPTGVSVKSKSDTLPFHPYFTVKDGFGLSLFLILFAVVVFFIPDAFAKTQNAIPADPLVTPNPIVPEWYLLPFYAILRAIPDKLGGVIALGASIGLVFAMPWIDRSHVRSMRYRPTARIFFFIWIVSALILGWCGSQEPDGQLFPGVTTFTLIDFDVNSVTWLSRVAALGYFGFFVALFFVPMWEKTRPVPDSLMTPVLGGAVAAPAGAVAAPETKG
ncbi:MAG TPA: cytochrome b N-terminal domain-containing protein [Caulobacteraceae bacterium]|nr:cytochrome b N-terminal domain-containing protein [Caulobacteraceae bacterium]